MENHTNQNIDVTGDVLHLLAVSFDTTLREVSKQFGDEIFAIVCKVNEAKEKGLFDNK